METIKYQGQDIQADKIAELGGFMGSLRGRERNGEDELWRDEEGCYYLRRQRYTATEGGPQYMHEAKGAGILFDAVHRIGINAAILWAINNLSGDSFDLRADAAGLIMDGRGYSDPNPVCLTPERRELVFDAAAQGRQERMEEIARLREQGDSPAASNRITLQLDDLASAMLRKVSTEGSQTQHPGESLHDLVNAAVTYYLCDDRNDQCGEFDLNQSSEALARAKRDRLMAEANAPVPPVTSEHTREPEAVETQPGIHRFTFDYPATERFCGMIRTVELTDEQMDRARALAGVFGLDLTAFLRGLVHNNALPGQSRRSDDKVKDLLQAEHIVFTCLDGALSTRIERAAQACGQSVDEFVADALGGDVDMYEENMLLHPTTGDLLDSDYEDLYAKVEAKLTVAPVGREHEPQFRNSLGKQRVNFGVYLRPDQLERLEYPHFVTDCETGGESAYALIPLDPEGSPYLDVGGQQMKPGEPISRLEAVHGDQRPAEQKGAA